MDLPAYSEYCEARKLFIFLRISAYRAGFFDSSSPAYNTLSLTFVK